MKKVINIQTTEEGLEYINIYEIHIKSNETEEARTYNRYLSQKEAEDTLKFINRTHKQNTKAWIKKVIVWC